VLADGLVLLETAFLTHADEVALRLDGFMQGLPQ
jgi:hypothetical protein